MAFAHADTVAIVQIQRKRDHGVVEAEVIEEIRGYKSPKTTLLSGIDAAVELMPRSRWIVATTKHQGATRGGYVLAMLPENDRNLALAGRLSLPAWRFTPIVLVVRIDKMIDFTGPKRDPVFEVVKVLRGNMKHSHVMDNGGGKFGKLKPFVAGEQLYLMAAWLVSEGKQLPRPFVYVHGLTAIKKEQIRAIQRDLQKDAYRRQLSRIQQAQQRILKLRTAWRFQRAPLVAEVVVSATAGEVSGLGGTHFLMAPKVWYRGRNEKEKLARGFRSRFPLLPAILSPLKGKNKKTPGYLFYGGGHGYFGKEKVGDSFIAAGKKIGEAPLARLPANDENRRAVKQWLAAQSPRFACKKFEEKIFVDKTIAPPKKFEPIAPVLEPNLPLEATGSPGDDPAWVRFEVVGRRSVPLPKGRHYVWLHCRLASKNWPGEVAVIPGRDAQVKTPEWVFSGVDLPDWPMGSEWWGYAIDDGGKTGSESKLFIASLFLPAETKDRKRLRQLLGAISKIKNLAKH